MDGGFRMKIICDICEKRLKGKEADESFTLLVDYEFSLCFKHSKLWQNEMKNILKQYQEIKDNRKCKIQEWRLFEFVFENRIKLKKRCGMLIT